MINWRADRKEATCTMPTAEAAQNIVITANRTTEAIVMVEAWPGKPVVLLALPRPAEDNKATLELCKMRTSILSALLTHPQFKHHGAPIAMEACTFGWIMTFKNTQPENGSQYILHGQDCAFTEFKSYAEWYESVLRGQMVRAKMRYAARRGSVIPATVMDNTKAIEQELSAIAQSPVQAIVMLRATMFKNSAPFFATLNIYTTSIEASNRLLNAGILNVGQLAVEPQALEERNTLLLKIMSKSNPTSLASSAATNSFATGPVVATKLLHVNSTVARFQRENEALKEALRITNQEHRSLKERVAALEDKAQETDQSIQHINSQVGDNTQSISGLKNEFSTIQSLLEGLNVSFKKIASQQGASSSSH